MNRYSNTCRPQANRTSRLPPKYSNSTTSASIQQLTPVLALMTSLTEPPGTILCIIRKYIQFVQRQNQTGDFISNTFNFIKNFTLGLVKLISEIILPESILRKILRSKFYVLYKDEVAVNVQDEKLVRLLLNTKENTHKSCFLVISPSNKADCIVELLNKNQLIKKVQQSYFFVGFVEGDQQIQSIRDQRPPQIVICRYNIYKELMILKRFVGEQQIRQISVEQLNRLTQEGRNMCKRDKNVLVKYRNFIRRQYLGGQMYVEQQEEEEINFIAREQDTHHIRQQNQEYQRIAKQEQTRFQQMRREQEKRKREEQMAEEREELRKVRKMSIPDQPICGEIVRFSFRCPDGSNVNRSFQADEKVQILYHWIQTNDQIELQDNKKRQFEILYSYPPTPLTDQKDKLLKQVFQSDQEKLLIRQL